MLNSPILDFCIFLLSAALIYATYAVISKLYFRHTLKKYKSIYYNLYGSASTDFLKEIKDSTVFAYENSELSLEKQVITEILNKRTGKKQCAPKTNLNIFWKIKEKIF